MKSLLHFHRYVPHNEITNVQLDIRHKVIHTKTLILDHKSLNQKKNYYILVNVSIYEKNHLSAEHKYDSMSLYGFMSDIKIIVIDCHCFKIIAINYREGEQKL